MEVQENTQTRCNDPVRESLFDTIADIESKIEGPETAEQLFKEHLLKIQEGKKQLKQELKEKAKKKFLEYLSDVFFVKEHIEGACKEKLSLFSIESCRTNLHPNTREITLFFEIKCDDHNKDIEFANLLSSIQRNLLKDQNLYTEVLYSSEKGNRDYSLIKLDFPYFLKSETPNVH